MVFNLNVGTVKYVNDYLYTRRKPKFTSNFAAVEKDPRYSSETFRDISFENRYSESININHDVEEWRSVWTK